MLEPRGWRRCWCVAHWRWRSTGVGGSRRRRIFPGCRACHDAGDLVFAGCDVLQDLELVVVRIDDVDQCSCAFLPLQAVCRRAQKRRHLDVAPLLLELLDLGRREHPQARVMCRLFLALRDGLGRLRAGLLAAALAERDFVLAFRLILVVGVVV